MSSWALRTASERWRATSVRRAPTSSVAVPASAPDAQNMAWSYLAGVALGMVEHHDALVQQRRRQLVVEQRVLLVDQGVGLGRHGVELGPRRSLAGAAGVLPFVLAVDGNDSDLKTTR